MYKKIFGHISFKLSLNYLNKNWQNGDNQLFVLNGIVGKSFFSVISFANESVSPKHKIESEFL